MPLHLKPPDLALVPFKIVSSEEKDVCSEGAHSLLGIASLPWCLEPGAELLNHRRAQACALPRPRARASLGKGVPQAKSVPSDADAEPSRVREECCVGCRRGATPVKDQHGIFL